MNDEILKFQGRLAAKRLELSKIELRIKGLVDSVRGCLDPFADLDDLRTDAAAQQAFELNEAHCRRQGLIREIRAIEKALGR